MSIDKNFLRLSTLASVRELRAFVAVSRYGNITAAAEALAVTGPAISLLLRSLEEKVGTRLFERTTRAVRLTSAGQQALGYAERILKDLVDLHTTLQEISAGRQGRLRVVATSTIAQTVLPQALARYAQRFPDVKLELDDCAPDQFQERLRSGQADIGIGVLDQERKTDDLHAIPVMQDHLSVVASDNYELPQGAMTWRSLSRYPLITMKPGYGIRTDLERAAREAGVQLNVVNEVTLLGTALSLVANGLGVSVLPKSILGYTGYPHLITRRLVRPSVVRTVSAVFPRNRERAVTAENFLALLQQEFGNIKPGPLPGVH